MSWFFLVIFGFVGQGFANKLIGLLKAANQYFLTLWVVYAVHLSTHIFRCLLLWGQIDTSVS